MLRRITGTPDGGSRGLTAVYAIGIAVFAAMLAGGLLRTLRDDRALPSLHFNYAFEINDLLEQKQWDEVLRELRIAATLDIDNPLVDSEILPLMLRVARFRNDRGAELFALRRLVAQQARDPRAHEALATRLLAAANPSEAIRLEAVAHANQALELDPGAVTAHLNLGLVAHLEGRPDAATKHWAAARRLNADYAQRAIASIDATHPGVAEAYQLGAGAAELGAGAAQLGAGAAQLGAGAAQLGAGAAQPGAGAGAP